MTKIDEIFLEYVRLMFVLIGIANEQNPNTMTSSNFGLKKEKKNQNCRRKLKLDSNDAKSQVDSENV